MSNLKTNLENNIKTKKYEFSEIIKENKPIFYHFLDGFLNDEGYPFKLTYDFIINNNIINNFIYSKDKSIYIIKVDDIDNKYSGDKIYFENISNKSRTVIYFINTRNQWNDRYILINKDYIYNYNDDAKSYKLNSCMKEIIDNILHYSIYFIGEDAHQTSVAFIKKGDYLHILSFNSGLNIDMHKPYTKNGTDFFLPYHGIKLNLVTDDDYINIFYKIRKIIFFNFLYKQLKNINYNEVNHEVTRDTRHDIRSGDVVIDFTLIKIYLDIITNNNKQKLTFFKYKLKDNDGIINDIYEYITYLKKFDKHFLFGKSGNHFTNPQIENFYILFIKYLDTIKNSDFNINEYCDNIKNFNVDITRFNETDVNISNIILNKITLHYYADELYIIPQENGSCTWYAFYWSIIFYFILIVNDPDIYIKFIKYLNKLFYDGLNIIFSDYSFNNEYNSNNSNYVLMKNICNKLIDVNILDKSILLNHRDFIFNNQYEIDIIKINNINKENKFYLKVQNIINEVEEMNQYSPEEFLNKFLKKFNISSQFNNNDQNNLWIFIFYKYNSHKLLNESFLEILEIKNILIKNIIKIIHLNDPIVNVDNLIEYDCNIDEIIKYNKLYYDKISVKSRQSPNDNYNQILKKILDRLTKIKLIQRTDININLINNYIQQINDLNKYEQFLKDNTDINLTPGFFTNYYSWVLYLDNLLKYLNTDYNIYLFIIFVHKINLILSIINELNIFINKVFLSIEDPFLHLYGKFSNVIFTKIIGKLIYNNIILKLFDEKFHQININYSSYRCRFNENSYQEKTYDRQYSPPKLLTNIYYNSIYNIPYLRQFIDTTKLSNLENKLRLNLRSLSDYKELVKFIASNPKYINESFNDITKIENEDKICDLFVLFNYNIMDDDKIKKKLMFYYYSLYNNIKYHNILLNFGLVLTNKVINFRNMRFNYDNNLINLSIYDLERIIIQKNINLLLNENFKEKSELEIILEYNKYLNNAIFIDETTIDFKGSKFKRLSSTNKPFYNLFNIDNLIYLLEETSDCATKILVINQNILIELLGIFELNGAELKIKINDIYFNNNKVIKYEEYKYLPFIHYIPSNTLHFIYSEDQIYKIVFFSNNFYTIVPEDKKVFNLLYETKIDNGIYIVEINNDNLILPNIKSDNHNFFKLCENYGINNINIFYNNYTNNQIKEINKDKKSSYNLNTKLNEKINFKKDEFLKNQIDIGNLINKLNILNLTSNSELLQMSKNNELKYDISSKLTTNEKYSIPINKLLAKINKSIINNDNIEKYKVKFKSILDKFQSKLLKFIDLNLSFEQLFNKEYYSKLYDYLQNVRLYNVLIIINNLLITYDENDKKEKNQLIFSNQVNIFNDRFNFKSFNFKYNFEAVFELFTGIELLYEQMVRYVDIINSFIKYENTYNSKAYPFYELKAKIYNEIENIVEYKMIGGNYDYPLHHIMMSKGKSAILTPLLALHFVLIYNKIVYILVPEHLKPSTEKKFSKINYLFNCIDKIQVFSDNDIKYKYLNNGFDDESNKDIVMIIDEFDSLIDPIKSNYNITIKSKEKFDQELCDFIKNIVIYIKNNTKLDITRIDVPSKYINYKLLFESDINNILDQINNGSLIENITWGIDHKFYYAIPYSNKDKPLESSNFTSSIMTLFLTYYYYIINNDYSPNNYVIKIIIDNNLFSKINYDLTIIEKEIIDIINSLDKSRKDKLFDEIFKVIFNKGLLSKNQSNVSFIDIININNIFKIGYSGTVNINLKPLEYLDIKFNTIIPDFDEEINVENAIKNAEIYQIEKSIFKNNINEYLNILNCSFELKNYQALIDQCGLFKNIKNEDIALNISNILLIDVLYINEKDEIYVINDKGKEEYNPNKFYNNLFMFYDQSHTVGVDVIQDKYPIMKGLCVVNKLSTYTQVAQAIFRLRKINLGHTIDICLLTDKIIETNSTEIYNLLKSNDNEKVEQSTDLLIYQTLKYEIRKNRKIEIISIPYQEYSYEEFKSNYKKSIYYNISKIDEINQELHKYYLYEHMYKLEKIYNHDEIQIMRNDNLFLFNQLKIIYSHNDNDNDLIDNYITYLQMIFVYIQNGTLKITYDGENLRMSDKLLKEEINKNRKIDREKIIDIINIKIKKYNMLKMLEKHDETIKYYYNNDISSREESLNNFYEGIFSSEELDYIKTNFKLNSLFCEINNYDKLLRLIYNIDSINIEHTHQLETEKEIDEQKEKNVTMQINLSNNRYIKIPETINYPEYDFIIYNFKKINNKKVFELLTMKVDDLIYILPNIFIQIDGFKFNKNVSGFLFVYIDNKILIIPGYLVSYFMYDYIIFDIKLKFVNLLFYKGDASNLSVIIDRIKTHEIFFNIINNKDYNDKYTNNELLLYFIIINIKDIMEININGITPEIIESINLKIKEIYNLWLLGNENRRLLFISDDFNDISKLKEKIVIFDNLDTLS